VAITSSFHPDADTHVEPCRYGKGFNTMAMLQTVLTDGDESGSPTRIKAWLRELWTQRRNVKELYDFKHWSERTVIALVMQSLDNSITTYGKKTLGVWRMTSRQGHGAPNPTWIPVANETVRRIAAKVGGTPGGNIGEPFGMPLTAHFIGGCAIGDSAETGVVDPYQRVFGHPGLHVADGSAVTANLGVNPSLTITAQAERAMAFWPNKGEADPRPPLGAAYERIAPVAPQAPVVPDSAPGALRLPIVGVS
jgi:cholesterol oxidase